MIIIKKKKLFSNIKNPNKVPFNVIDDDLSNRAYGYGNDYRDADLLVGLGKTGLTGGAVVGGLGLVEGGRSIYEATKAVKGSGDVYNNIVNNKEVGSQLDKLLKTKVNKLPSKLIDNKYINYIVTELGAPVYSNKVDSVIDGVKDKIAKGIDYSKGLKKSIIGRTNLAYKVLDTASSAPRSVLLNTGDVFQDVINNLKKNSNLSKQSSEVLDKTANVVKNAASSAYRFKNAKMLLKAAGTLGTAGSLLYINGRGLGGGRNSMTNK
jgi:hypothetical protein